MGANPRALLCVALASLAALAGCAGTAEYFQAVADAPVQSARRIAQLPWREYWTGLVFNGQKVGYTRLALRAAADAPERWDIESEAVMHMRFLGMDKKVKLHSLDRVRGDLTLESFRYDYELDGSALRLAGRVERDVLAFTLEASGSRTEQTLALAGPVHPASAIGLRPVLRGLAVGRDDRYAVFSGEARDLAEVEQAVLAYETSTLFDGPAYKLATRMLGVETSTWIAADGRPAFELALHGVMISALEDEASARRYLVAASLNRTDVLLDFSLLRSERIDAPRQLARLAIALDGVPREIGAPGGVGQRCTREGERLRCVIDRRARPAPEAGPPARYLRPSLAAPSNDGAIAALARSIAAPQQPAEERVRRTLAWISANIAKEAVDAFTAVDVLRERRAECQGHAYLFAALARALGLPTRIVNGVVYSEEHEGFLYHTWNEVWLEGEGWRAVDSVFGQAHADATHLKLVEGESAADLAPLAAMLGRARVAALGDYGRW